MSTKSPVWSAAQCVAQSSLSAASTASSSPTTVLAVSCASQPQPVQPPAQLQQPPQQPQAAPIPASELSELQVYESIFTDTGADDPEGGSGSLVSSPLASPGGPWITASSGRSGSQHTHTVVAAAAAAAGSTISNMEHEWTTVAKRRISMPVSRREIGKVIGQSGNTINAIRQQSGAHIDIDNKESDNGERQVIL